LNTWMCSKRTAYPEGCSLKFGGCLDATFSKMYHRIMVITSY
jgi:hypothetical protein